MTISDWVVLAILVLCVIGVVLHLHKRKLKGGCASCDGCPHSGSCRHEKREEPEEDR
jgi:hypothetical protein